MSVGLDIGSKSIKVVELTKSGESFSLRSAGAVAYVGKEIDKIEDNKALEVISNNIKKLFSDAKISSKEVFLGLPESQVFTRIIKFPLLNDQEIASAVKWEAEEYIPIPISEAVIEHKIIERRETGSPPQVLVLIIAVQKSIVEKYLKIASEAGLSLSGVETELLSLVRSLSIPNKTSVLIDMGAHSTDIAVAKSDQLFLTRSISMGGDVFTRAVAQSLGVQPVQAEEYKKTYGIDQNQLEGKINMALAPTFKGVIEEIKKAIHFYQNEFGGEAPSIAILSGGSAGMPGIIPEVAKTLAIEVVVGNSFGKIKVDQNSARSLASFQQLYAVAAGLAMREE